MAEKKGLKEFMEDLVKDNNLAEKFKDVVDPDKVAELAEEEGYYFTAEEYEGLATAAASGGLSWNDFKEGLGKFVNTAGTAVQGIGNVINTGEQAFNAAKNKWNGK